MLVECSIKNFAVIESLRVNFHHGFHVMTGETGAGKSMIVDALSLIAGGRGSAEFVRHGAEKAEIECLFEIAADHPVHAELSALGIEAAEEEMLVIRREISAQGKSVSRVNGQIVNLTMLKQIGQWLVSIHGQHEHQSLMQAAYHISLLDAYGQKELKAPKQRYDACFASYHACVKELQTWEQHHKDHLHKLDLFTFQVEEIAAAALQVGEDVQLEEEQRKLANAEKLAHGANEAYELLYGSRMGLESAANAIDEIEAMAAYDQEPLMPLIAQMKEAYFQLEDAAFQLRDYKEQIEFNPARLEQIGQRLNLIRGLKRKYGETIEEMMAYYEQIREQLNQLENYDERVKELQLQAEEERNKLSEAGAELTAVRRKLATALSAKVMEQLRDLHMDKTRFAVEIYALAEPTASGCDQVEFLIAPNPGEPLRPLQRIASGGELSRIMLAMKGIFAEVERIPVLVFDEVDTGVSGRAAQAIAEKLARISRTCQVFSVTHLPQVACMADQHYLIEKHIEGERTYTHIEEMDVSMRVQELARMLGGVEVTAMTTEHAQEMLNLAAQVKQQWEL